MGLLITGMHRSGTSMLAQWVDALGVPSAPGTPFPVNAANSEGLFELQEVVEFNEEWLGVLGGSWWAPPAVREQTWRSIDGAHLDRARDQLEVFRTRPADWYVKDPRLSLLLPLWDRLTLKRHPVLIAARSHRDVAMSLHVRNGTTFRRALALWWIYNSEIVRHVRDRPSLVLDFETCFDRPDESLTTLNQFLVARDLSGDSSRIQALAAAMGTDLKRQQVDHLDGTSERLAQDLDQHSELLRSSHGDSVPTELPDPPDWVQEALDELLEFWSIAAERDRARQEAAVRARQEAALAAEQDRVRQAAARSVKGRAKRLFGLGHRG